MTVWEKATKITHHLAGNDARLVLFDGTMERMEVILPNAFSVHYIYLYDDRAELVLPINSTYEHVMATCSLTVEGEIILN